MKRRAAIPMTAVALALALWSMSAYSADDDDEKKAIKEAQEEVLKLTESMNGGKGNAKAQAQAIKQKFKDDVKPIMWIYKPRNKGGIGMGAGGTDDIERTLGRVGSASAKGMTPKKRLDMKADLAKAAEYSRAVAELTELYASQYNDSNGKKNPAKWKEFTEKMRKGAEELSKAAKGNDAGAIQKAAGNLSSSCTECHSEFRQ